jgi:tRNA-dihydrouridine synthase A
MIGRAAYHRPWDVLADVDSEIFGAASPVKTREDVLVAMRPYIDAHIAAGGKLHQITRHMLGLFAGQPGARIWRRILSERANRPGEGASLLDEALERMRQPETLAG